MNLRLSAETTARIEALFAEDERGYAARILVEELSANLPGASTPEGLERLHFAALKISEGRIKELQAACRLAQIDSRDLLCAAGFELDADAHKAWMPVRRRAGGRISD